MTSVLFSFNLATIAAILVSHHALTYDLTLLLPAVLLLFFPRRGRKLGEQRWKFRQTLCCLC